ncbi:MAG: winged helix DNA-binding domain-containing protein [Myxococcota bacterium]
MIVDPAWLARWLVSHHGLAQPHGVGAEGARTLLARLRCIQIDPLDVIGTNADLVALARVDGLARGEVYDAVLPGHGFEHFFKERCLLPAAQFPAYRDRARAVGWWRTSERMKRIDEAAIDDVVAEVRDRGPLFANELADRGRVDPIDWSGWKGTAKASTLALEVAWVRCRVVVSGRNPAGNRRYDLPERALGAVATGPSPADPEGAALVERVEAMGLLPRSVGPWWGQLEDVRVSLADRLVAEGRLEQVQLPGTRRVWLAPAGFRDRPIEPPDDRMRILGPLDPLLWDRDLVRRVFGFDYVWEVYKPAATRKWGWYVVPLLHQGALVGRVEARLVDGELRVDRQWTEDGARWDAAAYRACLERHAEALTATRGGGTTRASRPPSPP